MKLSRTAAKAWGIPSAKASAVPELVFQCQALGLPTPELEYRFWPGRKFQIDVAFVPLKLGVEIEGVVYLGTQLGGRHVSPKGFETDIEKYAEAMALGWVILRCLPKHVTRGQAIGWIERILQWRQER